MFWPNPRVFNKVLKWRKREKVVARRGRTQERGMNSIRLNHATIDTADLAASVAFYG
jgi:hypothetical protein